MLALNGNIITNIETADSFTGLYDLYPHINVRHDVNVKTLS